MEFGLDDENRTRSGGDWDEYYKKEVARNAGGGRSFLMYGALCLVLLAVLLFGTAMAVAAEDETVTGSAMRLVGLAAKPAAAAPDPGLPEEAVPSEPIEAGEA